MTKTKKKSLIEVAKQITNQDKTNLQAYQNLYKSIDSESNYDSHDKYAYVYHEYQEKKKELDSSTDKNILKSTTLNDIQQQIDALQESLATAQVQVKELNEFDGTEYSETTNNEKLLSLKNDQLNENAGALIKAKQSLRAVKADMTSLAGESKAYTIKSPKSGVLHIIDQYKGTKYVSAGSTVAQVFPVLNEQKVVKVRMYVATMDISSVKLQQAIRFKVTRNVPKPIILNGRIVKIGVSPTKTSSGSFYEVVAKVPVNVSQRKLLRYGMTGNSSIITGKTTWFVYYKSKLLNEN